MGCGASSQPPRKETRTISQVTVAAQQRAEAAYRRQRVAQERAEESAIWRAEMEVERARMLKEMSGEGSRRLSYCQDVDELRKAAPDEFRRRMDDYRRQNYSVRAKYARNSLPVNGNTKCGMNGRRLSLRDSRENVPPRHDRTRQEGKNGQAKRKLSTTQPPDLESLRKMKNFSSPISPSSKCMEEKKPPHPNTTGTVKVVIQMVDEEISSEVPKTVEKSALIAKQFDVNLIPCKPVDVNKSMTKRRENPAVDCKENYDAAMKQKLYT